MTRPNHSAFVKKLFFFIALFIGITSSFVFAGPPDNGPGGIPPGGKFSIYFSNIIVGNDGVTGMCPTDQVIIGFNTGLTLNYGKPICKRVITLPDGFTGQTLRNTGTGWVVNSLLYNNGVNVGINTTNPAARLDVNGSIFPRGAQAHYDMSLANAGSTQWVRVGTLGATQGGVNATLRFYGGSGYNASGAQIGTAVVEFRTSNSSSVNSNGFCASSVVKRSGRSQVFSDIKFVANNAGCAATAYDVYILATAFIGKSYYTVDTDYSTSWSHVLAVGQSDPGASSSTVLIPDFENVINDNLSVLGNEYVSGNLGVGVAVPSYKLDVSGTGQLTGLRLPSGAANNYILTSDATGNARWLINNYIEIDPQVGANTTNYLSKWNGTSLVTSQVFDNGTNIGIGTSSPGYLFSVVNNTSSGSAYKGWFGRQASLEGLGIGVDDAGSYITASQDEATTETHNLTFGVLSNASGIHYQSWQFNGAERMRLNSSGNLGIGTSSPGQRIDVAGGSIRTTNQLISTLATGTAPLAVTSTTINTNLNADLLDGFTTGNASGNIPLSNGIVNANFNADMVDGFTPGNSSGNIAISNGIVNTNLNADLLDGQQGSYYAPVSIVPIFKLSLLPNGTPAVRTASTLFTNIQYVYGPFGYAQPSCPAGTTKQYKLFAEFVDNITSGGQNVAFRIALDDGTNLDFNLGSTWGSTPAYRTYLSSLFTVSNGNHAYSQIRINGISGPYVELRNAEIWTYCIY